MRRRILQFLHRASEALRPKPDPELIRANAALTSLGEMLKEYADPERRARAEYVERCHELAEAQQMRGDGPWLPYESRPIVRQGGAIGAKLREANVFTAQGATGDLELALQNVEWRREVNLSWLEFSRWGIQQIILICRLYWIKNPIARRLVNVAAAYVFGRGVEVSSPDDPSNEVIEDFFEHNKAVLGQNALTDLERDKWRDGNLFFCLFTDTQDTGEINVRMIDATEIADIVCDPNDSAKPWYYRRTWTEKTFDPASGAVGQVSRDAFYPALGYQPDSKPKTIGNVEVKWDSPIHHRKCGAVRGWKFGVPLFYPAVDWAKESRKFLEAVANVKRSLSQIAMTLTTKGGQQALAGAKNQLQTSVGPSSSLWDNNPPATTGATFASGTGTKLEAFQWGNAGGNPEEVRQYKLMCCMVTGVPETFLADVSTGNLATATTLDRPTELGFVLAQEEWGEDLIILCRYVLESSKNASGGRLREALIAKGIKPENVVIREAPKRRVNGRWVYLSEADRRKQRKSEDIEIKCTFPAIREGDQKALMEGLVLAATLNNRAGQFVGIDEKAFVRRAYEILDIPGGDELAEEQYPDSKYDPDRSVQTVEPPVKPLARPSGPGFEPNQPQPGDQENEQQTQEAAQMVVRALERMYEKANGHA